MVLSLPRVPCMVVSLPGEIAVWGHPCMVASLGGGFPAWWCLHVGGSGGAATGADGPGVPMSPQTSQGVQVRRFKTLSELIALYLQPNQGLVCTLLFPVEREKEKETVEDRDYSGMAG